MEKKIYTVYFAICEKKGDQWVLGASFDINDAWSEVEADYDHLTKAEREFTTYWIEGRKIYLASPLEDADLDELREGDPDDYWEFAKFPVEFDWDEDSAWMDVFAGQERIFVRKIVPADREPEELKDELMTEVCKKAEKLGFYPQEFNFRGC